MPISWSGTRRRKRRSPPATQQSAIDYNVFEGKHVKGLPRYTLTRGMVAVNDGEVQTQEGHGEFVRREPVNAVNKALEYMEGTDRAAQG